VLGRKHFCVYPIDKVIFFIFKDKMGYGGKTSVYFANLGLKLYVGLQIDGPISKPKGHKLGLVFQE
jgi:hypothetical protein